MTAISEYHTNFRFEYNPRSYKASSSIRAAFLKRGAFFTEMHTN